MSLVATDPAAAQRLHLARLLARQAGALQRARYETDLTIATKSRAIDLVTEVDRACEALIVDGIASVFPGDAILAEEGGRGASEGGDEPPLFRWIIDPLDGTTNFAHGFPRFCVSIGIERAGERVVGVVYDPLLDECFEAAKGRGAWLGNRRLAVSRESDLARGLFATGFAYDVHDSADDNLVAFGSVVKSARGIRRDGSAALDLCYVAAGRVDGYWERKLNPWDVAAGFLIVEEAGGRLSGANGGKIDPSGRDVVATNGRVHEALLAAIRAGANALADPAQQRRGAS